ncbi:MAG TPA: TPM domain-containing protein [Anaeromyxobacteraceae bacterium]|nr:TPM domain-containing protein [Anaeromyxobacteraceae bacterium]
MRALALAALVALPAAAGALEVPRLSGPVVDEAGLLDRAAVRRLEALSHAAQAAEGGAGVQLQYLVVRSLEGEAIEDYSMKVAEAWKLGTKAKGNGVLVLVAVEDRAVRIEVGEGIEGGLTDVQSSRIIRGTIVPAFREGRYGEGLYGAGVQILSALGALPKDVARSAARPSGGVRVGGLGFVGLFVLFIVLRALLFGFSGRRRRGFWGGGGPFIGGGWGGGGFGGGGGGGWSGGGGGFSGGGASGRW